MMSLVLALAAPVPTLPARKSEVGLEGPNAIGVAESGRSTTPVEAQVTPDIRNRSASESACPVQTIGSKLGGLVDISPDGTGTTTHSRDCTILGGIRQAAQVGRSIEVSDGAIGPASGPGLSTAASASYALSLVNTRPQWATSSLVGEADGVSIFARQAKGDTAAILANVGVQSGYATTLESYTFSAAHAGMPIRAVRTQLGVVNSRDGGEYGLVLQAANGAQLSAGLRIASLGTSTWKNYFEAIDPLGQPIVYIRGSDGTMVGGDIQPNTDLRNALGSAEKRYTATYTQILQLAETRFSSLPKCSDGIGSGTIAFIVDSLKPASSGTVVKSGGGGYRAFLKCDGLSWTNF